MSELSSRPEPTASETTSHFEDWNLVPLLDPHECARVIERIDARRADWIPRNPELPFYSLGAASYLDVGGGRTGYYDRAAAYNPLLEHDFGWLYRKLQRALEDHLRAHVIFEKRAALPGFHIFLAHPAFTQPLGRIHFDLQFHNIEWPAAGEMDFSRPVSFTLAVRLPRSGAGLHLWDIDKAAWDAMSPATRDRIGEEVPPHYVRYRTGSMVCHSGLVLHRIAPAAEHLLPDDMRVTLQGHALPGRQGYYVYW